MSENMVQELERLRKLLDTTSPEQLKRNLTRAASGSDTVFSGALSAAEVRRVARWRTLCFCCRHPCKSCALQNTVDRLNDAMESGEEQVDAAFRRTSKT